MTSLSPSPSLLANLRQELSRLPPFAQMDDGAIDFFLTHAEQRYFAQGEVLIGPKDGPVTQLFYIRQGAVRGVKGVADLLGGAIGYEAGDLFPASAALAGRAVTATYEAVGDTFVLALPVEQMQSLAGNSSVFADFLNQRILNFLALSRQTLQASSAAQTLAEQSLESPLGDLVRNAPVTCPPHTPLREVLQTMHQMHIGSMLVVSAQGAPLGILTRHDVLDRVVLAEASLDAPIAQVMVHPVASLTTAHTAEDAAVLMSRHGIRHVPVTRDGAVVGILSERDLFALQRLSLRHVSGTIRAAENVAALKQCAEDIRNFARNLLGQGVQARQITTLISHLNDLLTDRLLHLLAQTHGIDLHRLCWVALGSEGRGEQTIATDQDNALILPDDITPAQRDAVRAFAHEVNLALDVCGYPLCKGGIMAGEPNCCRTLSEWRDRFASWIDHGAPKDLLDASIYFDFRHLAGNAALADALKAEVVAAAQTNPRFLKQMAVNALTRRVPLNWHGGIDEDDRGGVDLKLQGAAIFCDVARIESLALGIGAVGTRERLEAVGAHLRLAPTKYQAWIGAFEFLQMLRLRAQVEGPPDNSHPNHVTLASLNDIDRRILKESFRVAREMQQRLQLEYDR